MDYPLFLFVPSVLTALTVPKDLPLTMCCALLDSSAQTPHSKCHVAPAFSALLDPQLLVSVHQVSFAKTESPSSLVRQGRTLKRELVLVQYAEPVTTAPPPGKQCAQPDLSL
jgi:hypothetical protein